MFWKKIPFPKIILPDYSIVYFIIYFNPQTILFPPLLIKKINLWLYLIFSSLFIMGSQISDYLV